jgi:hypothetical protein
MSRLSEQWRDFRRSSGGRLAPIQASLVFDTPALRAARDRVTRSVLADARESVAEVTRALEKELEGLTRLAVKGKLWRAWKSDVFPSKGRIAREPTGTVYVNGGNRSVGAMTFFSQRGRIKGRAGQWLAIPTEAAGSRGRQRDLTPGEWEDRNGQKLRLIYGKNGRPGRLVAQGTTNKRTGSYRAITRRRTAADERRGYMRGEPLPSSSWCRS